MEGQCLNINYIIRMGTIHKLTKAGATIFPATVTDAVVHPNTKTVLSNMINVFNLSSLYPTSGIDGTRYYDLTGAVAKIDSVLPSELKVLGTKIYFETKDAQDNVSVLCYNFTGSTFSLPASWTKTILSTEEIERSVKIHEEELTVLAQGVNITLTATPTRVISGTQTTITVTAHVDNIVPDRIELYQNDSVTPFATGTNVATFSGSITDTFSATQLFYVEIVYKEIEFTKSISVPVTYGDAVYGFGSAISDISTPITTAQVAGVYTVSTSANNQWFFLKVPIELTQPTHFIVNGVEMEITKFQISEGGEEGEEIEHYTHWVYQSGAQYNTGTTLVINIS